MTDAPYVCAGEAVCYVSVMESADMLAEATKAALKKAKALGITGPFSPLDLRDLTEPVSDEVVFDSYTYTYIVTIIYLSNLIDVCTIGVCQHPQSRNWSSGSSDQT